MRYRAPVIRVVLVALALAFGLVAGGLKSSQKSNVSVLVNVPKGVNLSVYQDLGGDGPYHYNAAQAVAANLSTSQRLNLEPATYDLVAADPGHVYANNVSQAVVNDTTTQITPHLSYTDQKLQSMLPAARDAAQTALYKAYPTLSTNYVVAKDSLFMLGDWYGALLQPKSPDMDTLRVILEEQGGNWKVAVRQPDISIGEPSNPNIPSNVVEAVDQL